MSISHSSVIEAIKCLATVCPDEGEDSGKDCLICFAKNLLNKFNQLQRRIDRGVLHASFPENKKKFDKDNVNKCYEKIKTLCDSCVEYHNDKCLVFYVRNALELILFGAKLPITRMSYTHFLLEQNIVTKEQLDEALIIFQELNPPIGSYAFARGLLTQKHVIDVLNQQKNSAVLFGQAAKSIGLLTDYQIDNILQFQSNNKITLSNVLIELGYMDEKTSEKIDKRYEEYYNLKKKSRR